MSEMVDRVANFLREEDEKKFPGKYERLARVAIAAMREPTEKMIWAPREAGVIAEDYPVAAHVAEDSWRAMIDEALK